MSRKAVEIAEEIQENPYAWPGGYPRFAVTEDGAALCCKCLHTEREAILESDGRDGFEVVDGPVNWEDSELTCDGCGDKIESAYGDDENE